MHVSVLAMQSTVTILSTSGPCQGDFPKNNRSIKYGVIMITNPARQTSRSG